jgi:hypothetical protein
MIGFRSFLRCSKDRRQRFADLRAGSLRLIQLVSSVPPIGSGRTRIRLSSKTTMHPWSSALSTLGRLASNRADCCSARRCDGRRSRTTDGLVSLRSDNNVPKSVSAEISTRDSRSARARTSGSGAACIFQSRTCFASWPARRNPSATAGDSALSTRNLTRQ